MARRLTSTGSRHEHSVVFRGKTTKVGSASSYTYHRYEDYRDIETKTEFEHKEHLDQEYSFAQGANNQWQWTGNADHTGRDFRKSTMDGTLIQELFDSANNKLDFVHSASNVGSEILDVFDAEITPVTTTAGNGQGYASTSGSDSGIRNQVTGHALTRTGPTTWVAAQPAYSEEVFYDGYRNPNYRDLSISVGITDWIAYNRPANQGSGDIPVTWVDQVVRVATGFTDFWMRPVTWVATAGQFSFGISDVQGYLYGDEVRDFNTQGYAYATGQILGAAAMSIVLAPVMAPLAVGAFGFTAGFAGTTVATVGFGSLTVGMVSHELLGIYSNWDQMDGAQRLSSVGTMVAGFAGGSTGAQSVRNLPKGFYQKWELNGKLTRVRVDVRNWRLRSDTWGQPTATTGGLGEFHLEYIGPKANNATQRPVPILPKYDGGKTSGVLRFGESDVSLLSGYDGPSASMPKGTPGMNGNIKSHVEAHAASIMRQEGLQEATLYINRIPCSGKTGCDAMLTRMLPEGARLSEVLSV